MTDTKKIAALAAELTRLGKMPKWIDEGPRNHLAVFKDETDTSDFMVQDSAVLAALSGVAAEVAADEQITIEKTASGYRPSHYLMGCLGYLPTIHEALIAALKQVETEKKQ